MKRFGLSSGTAAFAATCLASLAGVFLPEAYDRMGSAGTVLYVLHPWLWVLPLALAGPFLSSWGGVPPLISFFPPGLSLLLSPRYPGMAGRALFFLLLSLLSAEAGREGAARKNKNGKGIRKGARGNGKGKRC